MQKGPRTISSETTLREAVRLMLSGKLQGLTVVDSKGKIQGILSLCYLLRGFTPDHVNQLSEGILSELEEVNCQAFFGSTSRLFITADFFKQDVRPLSPDDSLIFAASEMERQMLEFLPVSENGILVGTVSRHDLMKAFFDKSSSADECGKDA